MEIVVPQNLQFPPKTQCLMPAHFKLSPSLLLRLTPAGSRLFSTATAPTTTASDPAVATISEPLTPKPRPNGSRRGTKRGKRVSLDARQMKLNWLDSLSCPFRENCKNPVSEDSGCGPVDSGWVIGVDPDISGALAVLKPDNSVEVFDSPHLKVLVGKRVRKRLDAKSIIQLLQNVDAPVGTTAYIEQSIPYPHDVMVSKMIFSCLKGWWSGGFGYGLWIGILVASGYSVVPIPSLLWKNEFKLAGNCSSKDDSRELASTLFPSMSSLLKRKKDHGRAEALLIAAYGKGLKVESDTSHLLEDLMP